MKTAVLVDGAFYLKRHKVSFKKFLHALQGFAVIISLIVSYFETSNHDKKH